MDKAAEIIRKIAQTIVEGSDCGVLAALGDCGKCPYLEYDEEICEKQMKKDMKEFLQGGHHE